ncbi:unnamed protein product [Camellia sinensis]
MTEGNDGSPRPTVSPYEEAMDALSSLITKRSRADKSNKGDRFDFLFDYLKMLDLDEPISRMNVIHVAGTKGKVDMHYDLVMGMPLSWNLYYVIVASILVFSHLLTSLMSEKDFDWMDVDICEEKFLAYFWWCWDRLKEKTSDDIPMPTYFRFLALLAFKIFAAEQVDVAILEVGLGGKFDATNVVQKPIVCGITSLGYDHMEILGNTLGEIAGEKAGIFKQGVPAFTVHQPDEAMRVLEEKASQLDMPFQFVHLQVAPLLDVSLLNGVHLGLSGLSSLPEQFIKGLTTATLQGRAQIVPDRLIDIESPGDLVFYMDGAHSPESMEVCAKWFCLAIKEENKQQNLSNHRHDNSSADHKLVDSSGCKTPMKNSTQGVHFKKALFVPNISVYNKVWSSASPPPDLEVDLSWQMTLQKVWENLIKSEKGGDAKNADLVCEGEDDKERCVRTSENSTVFPSLPLAIKWLRDTVQQHKSVRFQVL